MKNYLSAALFILLSAVNLTAQTSPSSYLQKMAAEHRKMQTKQLKFIETFISQNNPKRQEMLQSMVQEQIKSSQLAIKRIGSYKKDTAYYSECVKILNHYSQAFSAGWDAVAKAQEQSTLSDASFNQYLDAYNTWCTTISDLEIRRNMNNEGFIARYNARSKPTQHGANLQASITLSIYTIQLRQTFFKIPNQLEELKAEISQNQFTAFDSLRLNLANYCKVAKDSVNTLGAYPLAYKDEHPKLDTNWLNTETINHISYIEDAANQGLKLVLQEVVWGFTNDQNMFEKKKQKLLTILNYLLTTEQKYNAQCATYLGMLLK